MATDRPQKSGKEIVDALHGLSLDTREEILAMSSEEVRARLEAEGIDTGALQVRTKKLIAQARLSMAGERRDAALSAMSGLPPQYSNLTPTQLRSQITQRLQRATSDASYVAALFARFKEAEDEDLPGLLEALLLLDDAD